MSNSILRNFIEVVGINTDCMPTDIQTFKQFNIEETVCIPKQKPDIEQVIKVIVDPEIISTRVIQTPIGTSLEGEILTGWKVIIEGFLNQKIQYVADLPSQPSHAAHSVAPFSTFVVLPEDFIDCTPLTVTPFIEDIYVEQVDKRCVFKNITIMVTVELC